MQIVSQSSDEEEVAKTGLNITENKLKLDTWVNKIKNSHKIPKRMYSTK